MRSVLAIATVVSAILVIGAGAQPGAAVDGDQAAVRTAVLNYINSYYQTRPGLLEESVHANLKKRDVRRTPAGDAYLNEMTRSQLIAYAKTANANGRWSESSRRDVVVFDIDGEIASAKLIADGWVDYFHLAKMDDRWLIVNVLWAPR